MVPDSALAACQILLHNTKKEQIFLCRCPPCAFSPLFGRVRGCVASFGEGQVPVPLPADTGRIWAAVPPFGRNAYSGHRFARDEKKSRKNKIATSPRSADCCPCPSAATDWRDGFTHLRVGQAERLACRKRLPNAFFGQKPAPTFSAPRGQLITF